MAIIVDSVDPHFYRHWNAVLNGIVNIIPVGKMLVDAVSASPHTVSIEPGPVGYLGICPLNPAVGIADVDALKKAEEDAKKLGSEKPLFLKMEAFGGGGCNARIAIMPNFARLAVRFLCCSNAKDKQTIIDNIVIETLDGKEFALLFLIHELIHALHFMGGQSLGWYEFGSVSEPSRRSYLKSLWVSLEDLITVGKPLRELPKTIRPASLTENMFRCALGFPQRLEVHPHGATESLFKTVNDCKMLYRGYSGQW